MGHLSCLCLGIVIVLLYASSPQLLNVIYGQTAVSLGRPLSALIFLAIGLQHINLPVENKARQVWSLRLALVGVFFAFMLKNLRWYMQYDVAIIDYTLELLKMDTLYTPVIASTLVECLFLSPPLILLMLEGGRVGTIYLSALLLCPILPFNTPRGCLFVMPILLVVASTSLSAGQYAFKHALLCATILFLLWGVQTAQCDALPWLLKCPVEDSSFQILMQHQSQTGQVSVLESPQYRLLRADHSLLGGEWQGDTPGQSIFSTFYMQAMALYTTTRTRDTGSETTVLLIGLGAGTSVKTILDTPVHDVLVQVAEIDCAVISAAQQYFGLPTNDSRLTVKCEDARDAIRQAILAKRKFDLISHDISTGGDLAFPLFTLQFFQDLSRLLAYGGTLSVNYVWSQKDNDLALQSLSHTLKQVFQTVKVYLENGELDKVNNLVIFCKMNDELVLSIPDSGRMPRTNLGIVAVSMPYAMSC